MIKRFCTKNLLGFKELELEFSQGLNVFSGPSGAGKSVLMQGILFAIGVGDVKADFVEIETTDAIYRATKKDKSRWFINDEPCAKKVLSENAIGQIVHLSANDANAFSRKALLDLIDDDGKLEFDKVYTEYLRLKENAEGLKILAEQIEEKREFLSFELSKIDAIDPKANEEEELGAKKKLYLQKEKLQSLTSKVAPFMSVKSAVQTLFEILNKNASLHEDFFAELDDAIESASSMLAGAEDIDAVMNRLDELSYLVKKYGGISEALSAKYEKTKRLEELERVDEDFALAEILSQKAKKEALKEALKLSERRRILAKELTISANKHLKELKLQECEIKFYDIEPDAYGIDNCEITLGGVGANKISSGEARRLRLALFAASVGAKQKAIILDEADSNLSGAESAAVARLLKELSKKYQLFAITHQAQTAAVAESHFLVTKDENGSFVARLNDNARVEEIARILGGGKIEPQAIELAKTLIG